MPAVRQGLLRRIRCAAPLAAARIASAEAGADTALWLSRFFGMSEMFWINLQARFDLEIAKERLADRLEREVSVLED